MAPRWLPIVPIAFSLCGLGIGLVIMGCQEKPLAGARPATANESFDPPSRVPVPVPMPVAGAPLGERSIDTTTSTTPAAPAPSVHYSKARPKPGSDENLPSWVPLRGRLTVVEAPDLAENLGLVPRGATKNAQARISVADAIDQQAGQAGPQGVQSSASPWLAANGRFHGTRASRGRR